MASHLFEETEIHLAYIAIHRFFEMYGIRMQYKTLIVIYLPRLIIKCGSVKRQRVAFLYREPGGALQGSVYH